MKVSNDQCGIIFDMDGVIVDTAAYHFEAFARLGEEAGFNITEEQFRITFGWHNADIFPYLYGRPVPDEELARMAGRKESIFQQAIRGKVTALPGVSELVPALKAAGFHLAIGSSTPRANVDLILGELGFQPFFEAIASGEDVIKGKPDPQVFLLAAERLGVPPERCVVIEDAVAGVQAALNAGMKALAVTTNHSSEALRHAHRVVDRLTEVSAVDFLALLE
jgi:beta-phosphoglucomutase